jgi:hypothetical protein
VQVLAELQIDGVAGRVGQGQNGQFEAPSRDCRRARLSRLTKPSS